MLGFLVIRHILSTQMRLGFAFGGAFAEHHGKFRGKKLMKCKKKTVKEEMKVLGSNAIVFL